MLWVSLWQRLVSQDVRMNADEVGLRVSSVCLAGTWALTLP